MGKMKSVFLNDHDQLTIIDQTKLPGQLVFLVLDSKAAIIDAIAKLRVRGAPAIGIAAAYGVYILAKKYPSLDRANFVQAIKSDIAELSAIRPTAINLAWALARMATALSGENERNPEQMIAALKAEAIAIDQEDAAISRRIAELGAPLISNNMGILTHCNAGWLATSELGTALAPLYLAKEQGKTFRVYCDETRPLLQGARLTAYELMAAGIDTTLICDNMAASLMAAGQVDIVFVGADRIAKNGDIANKIGTLSLAINAKYFGIPFYVCAPSSTLDPLTATGQEIVIEQRSPEEVTELWYCEPMAPPKTQVYNPAFDITPRELITGIITETGIF